MDLFKNLSAGFVGQAAGNNTNVQETESDAPKVDAADMGKMMQMFQDIMGKDPSMKQKADSIWKFLDDLHKNNPKEYNSFVNKHIAEGKEELEKEKKNELKKDGIQSEPLICAKVRLFELKTGHKEAEEKKVDIKLFEFDSQEEIKGKDQGLQKEKHLAKPVIYINICHSEKVKAPLTKNREYADPKNDKTWAIIPVSYAKESETADMIIYDAHINSEIVKKCKGDPKCLNGVLVVILKRFEQLMINKYRIDISSTHILSKSTYMSNDVNKKKPDLHLLMPDCDPKTHKEYVETIKQFQKPDVKMPTMAPVPEEKEELSADDLLKKLNLPSAGASKSSKPKVVDVTGQTAKKQAPKPVSKPPPVTPISHGETEIKETVVKSIDDFNFEQEKAKLNKTSKIEPKVTMDFNIEHKKGNIRLKFELPKEESAAYIDLQLNETSFILESPNYFAKQSFHKFHPQSKIICVHSEPGEQGPKTSFSKSKKVLTIYLTEK